MLDAEKLLRFIESAAFSSNRDRLAITNEEMLRLQLGLCNNPEAGDVIKGAGGVRKIRFAKPGSGKGKSGSFRVLYLHVPSAGIVLLFTIYPKSEKATITAAEVRGLAIAAAHFKNQIERGFVK